MQCNILLRLPELSLHLRTAALLFATATLTSPNVAAQEAASPANRPVEVDQDTKAALDNCTRLPRRQELLCGKKVLSSYAARLEPLLPPLEETITQHRRELFNQEATARGYQSELAGLERTRGQTQARSQREVELRVYIAATKWNIERERTAIAEKSALLSGARRDLVNIRETLQQIDDELQSRPYGRQAPAQK